MPKPTEKEIVLLAYEIWKKNHRPVGRNTEFYKQAEKELSERPLDEPAPSIVPG